MSNDFAFTYEDFIIMSVSLIVAADELSNIPTEHEQDSSKLLVRINSLIPKIDSCVKNCVKDFEYNLSASDFETLFLAVNINIIVVENNILNAAHEKQRIRIQKDLKPLKFILKKIISILNEAGITVNL
jgi:hypothetical protein